MSLYTDLDGYDRVLALDYAFDRAVADIGLTGDVAQRVSGYFRRATIAQRRFGSSATPVPDNLPFNYE